MKFFLTALLVAPAEVSAASAPSAAPSCSGVGSALQRHDLAQLWHCLTQSRRAPDAAALTPGAVYECTVVLPIVGRQTFRLHIHGRGMARITLLGRLALDEPTPYRLVPQPSGQLRVDLDFNEPARDLLARWRTRIRAVWYNSADDYATIVIAPPLVPAISLRLSRLGAS